MIDVIVVLLGACAGIWCVLRAIDHLCDQTSDRA